MRVVALVSGGKDSCYNMMQCIAAGHEIVALANLKPHSETELDSYMYQSVGYEAIEYIAKAMELPLYRDTTLGLSTQTGKVYEQTANDEVEDLFNLLQKVKDEVEVEAASVGAILSDYQRVRVENVCIRLGLVPLAYLWQRDQQELLNEMIKCEIDAIVIKVAALGLDPKKHLGRTLSSLQPHLHSLHEKYGINVCGEGGEYETLTLDCPLFKSRLIIDSSETVLHSNDPVAPVGYLKLNKIRLAPKKFPFDLATQLEGLRIKDSDGYVTDYGTDACDLSSGEEDTEAIPTNSAGKIRAALINQKANSFKSSNGWLWIGGIQGDSTNYKEAMEQATGILQSILSDHDKNIQDVCSLTMFVSDMSRFSDFNDIYSKTFSFPNPPCRACVEIPYSCPVTITALAWSQPPGNSGDTPTERHTMHVQSRSHWAPANIGPYSQAVGIGDLIHLAGQIGLVPGSLEMVKGGIRPQCQLALRHVGRLLKAVDPNVNLRDVVQGICYVTDVAFIEHSRKLWEEKTNNAIVNYVVVSQLPKDALIEWHVWAHKHNNQFEYEETGKNIEDFSISIYRRWNYENNIAAIVCHIDYAQDIEHFNWTLFTEAMEYAVQKLKHGHEQDSSSVYNITVFYCQEKLVQSDSLIQCLDELTRASSLVYTCVPVLRLKTKHTCMSICGVRNQ